MSAPAQPGLRIPPANVQIQVPSITIDISTELKRDQTADDLVDIFCLVLKSIIYLKNDIDTFISAKCYEPRASPIPFTREHFVGILRYYHQIFHQNFIHVSQLNLVLYPRIHGTDPAPTHGDAGKPASAQGDTRAPSPNRDDTISTLLCEEAGLDGSILLSELQQVPPVSPREILLWLLFNSREFRNEVATASQSRSFKRLTSAKIPSMMPSTGVYVPLSEDVYRDWEKRRAKSVDYCVPVVFFFCLGYSENFAPIHKFDATFIGATGEKFPTWKQLDTIRRDARVAYIGQRDVDRWSTHLAKIRSDDSKRWTAAHPQLPYPRDQIEEDALSKARKQELKDNRLPLLQTPRQLLRAASRFHVGQAYTADSDFRIIRIGCCLLCKLAIRYREVFADSNQSIVNKFDRMHLQRAACSCAEVACSMWCELGHAPGIKWPMNKEPGIKQPERKQPGAGDGRSGGKQPWNKQPGSKPPAGAWTARK
ncbi:hypothetical protein PT974_08414 [Cladobotryum mycophilum]|uniref:Uncharacterized protein n=1 Tax=Cladobotryum mycophilum TaxID=491253 RepID=A0ABR0SDB3_9HYPO